MFTGSRVGVGPSVCRPPTAPPEPCRATSATLYESEPTMNSHRLATLIKPALCITLPLLVVGCGKEPSKPAAATESSNKATMPTSVTPSTAVAARVETTSPEATTVSETARTPSVLAQTGSTRYAVFNVVKGDFLKLRELPDGKSDELTALKPDARNVRLTGNWRRSSQTTWVQVKTDEGEGWTNRYYLTEQTTTPCGAPAIDSLLERFTKALRERNGEELGKLTPPGRGLILTSTGANFNVRYRQDEVEQLFESTDSKKWWFSEQGKALNGSFTRVALPKLNLGMVAINNKRCVDSATEAKVPAHLRGLVNYLVPPMAAHHARPWIVGVEFVAGRPYIGLLVET